VHVYADAVLPVQYIDSLGQKCTSGLISIGVNTVGPNRAVGTGPADPAAA